MTASSNTPDVNASAPDVNASAPDANASAPDANASAPDANASAPDANASAQHSRHTRWQKLRKTLRGLYYGATPRARAFRLFLLAFDLLTIGFFIITSMVEIGPWVLLLDYGLAVVLSLDYLARLAISNRKWRFALQFTSLADLVVILSLMAPILFENFAFMRVMRMLRLLRSYHVLKELREFSAFFKRNEEVIQSTINLLVFVFVVTAIVYVLEVDRNPEINTYLDALYFTVATLTTTGFGDITMDDTLGRMMAVIIMVFGVALFLRLVQVIFRPAKVHVPCEKCGLSLHDPDAVHCKHCGATVRIPTEGEW